MTITETVSNFILFLHELDKDERKRVLTDIHSHFCLKCFHKRDECNCQYIPLDERDLYEGQIHRILDVLEERYCLSCKSPHKYCECD